MKRIKNKVAFLLFLGMLISVSLGSVALAADPQEIDINVDQDDLLDIVLTLGQTDSDVSNVEADLTAALVAMGVPEDKIKIQAVESNDVSAGDTSAGWEVFDHTNNVAYEIPYYRPYYNEVNNNYNLNNHIEVSTTDGTDIDFYGYGSPSYKDFMYMPDSDPGKKIIDFYIQEGEFHDALDGPGFFINTGMSDNAFPNKTMTGYLLFFKYTIMSSNPPVIYLYSFTNQNVYNFHGSTTGTVSNVASIGTLVATASVSPLNSNIGTIRKIKIEATPTGMQMWYADAASGDPNSLTLNPVTWNLAAGGSSTEVTLTDNGSYGFGPMNSYLYHGCSAHTHFTFNDITMSTESSKRFSEVIREPEWRDESKRFIINAEDGAVSDFSDPEALGEILARLGNENIHYLGWGYDDADGEAFIQKNDGNGIYIDKDDAATDTYSEQINALATYIYNEYVDGVVNDTEYLIYGKPSSLSITPESEQTNTADIDWPNGKWLIDQDETYYENPTGVVPYDNVPLSNLDISFTETGKYDIYYKAEVVKTVYVHRQPVAKFTVSVSDDGNYTVNIDDNAYDPDTYDPGNDAYDEGIDSTAWYYKETTASSWTSGKPTTFEADKEYIIKQVVTDGLGVQSDPYLRYVSTTSGGDPSTPVAEFKVSPSPLRTYVTDPDVVSYTDTSYDPNGEAINGYLWKVSLDGTEIYSASSPMTNFEGVAAGTYKITLEVKNASNVWSEPVARYLTVIVDTTAPTAECDTSSGTYNEPKVVTLTFSDEEGGSGFSHRFAVLSDSATTPTSWGSMGTNSEYSVSISSPGTYYLHYKAVDYANNESTPAYFGPFTLTDNTAPSTPNIDVSPAYVDGTWATEALTATASGSTDDFTADEDLVYSVSTDGTNYTTGNSKIFSATGMYTVYFKVTDESNNTSSVASKTVKVDVDDPSVPDVDMQSDGSSYIAGTWATTDVDITLSGSTDVGSGFSVYQYKIDSGDWQDGGTYTFSSSGKYTFYYRSEDNAGNVSATNSKIVWVDVSSPSEPTIETSPEYTDGTWSKTAITVSASGSTDDMTADGDLVYEVSTDGTNYTAGSSKLLDTSGEHTVYFKVTDEGGNSTVVSKTVKVDLIDPSTPDIDMVSNSLPYIAGTWATADVDITLSGSTDDNSGVEKYQYKIDDGDWQDGTTYTFDTSGEYTFYYRSVDNAGNISAEGSKKVKLDKEEPVDFVITTSVTTIDSIDISASTTDAMSGMAVLGYRIYNGSEWSEWKATVNETLTGYTRGEEVTLKVEAIDNAGNVRTVSVTVSTLENTSPTAVDDTFTMKEDAASTELDLTANDTDADIDTDEGDTLTVASVSALTKPSAGKLTLVAGKVVFKPAADYNGTVKFTYVVEDEFGAQDTGLVTVNVTAVNDPPDAYNDSATVDEDSSVIVYVLNNDEDIDSTLTIDSFSNPANGTVEKSGSGLKYTPDENYNGKDTFTYTITDGKYESTAQVSVTVDSVNDAPVLNNDTASTYYEVSVEIDVLANDSDIETDGLSIASVSAPSNGTAVISSGKVVYTPAEDFVGTDTFNYTVVDGDIEKTALVTVEVSYPEYYKEGTAIFEPEGGGDEGEGGEGGGEEEIVIIKPPTKGSTNSTGNDVYYTPDSGSGGGIDTYTFVVKKNGQEVVYQVITTTDPATGEAKTLGYGAPLNEDSFNTNKNTELVIDLSEYIGNYGDITGISIDGQPANGSVRIEDGKLIYTPGDGFVGMDGLVITVSMGDESIPYAATFNVLDEETKAPFFSWWCVVGWLIAAILLLINYLWRREFFNEKKLRVILYIVVSVVLMVLLCWLRHYVGYVVSIIIEAAYIAFSYIYAALRSRKNETE